jgi:hypothetical protein
VTTEPQVILTSMTSDWNQSGGLCLYSASQIVLCFIPHIDARDRLIISKVYSSCLKRSRKYHYSWKTKECWNHQVVFKTSSTIYCSVTE